MNFAERLKKLRKENGLTQEKLATNIQKNRSTIAGYETERKQPEYETLSEIAKFFDCSVDYLLGETDKRSRGTEGTTFDAISVDGLNEADIQAVRHIVEGLKKSHSKIK